MCEQFCGMECGCDKIHIEKSMNDSVKQIFLALRQGIADEKFSEDDPLPSLREIAEEYQVSVYVARQAVEELIRRNLAESRHGSGTYVTKRGRARKIGIVIPGLAYSEFFRPFADRMVALCKQGGYRPVLKEDYSRSPRKRAKEVLAFVRELVKERVAGVVFQPLELFPSARYANVKISEALDKAGIPLVLVDSDIVPPPERSRYDVVGINNHDAGVRVAEHLLSLGVTEMRFVLGKDADWNIKNRLRGVASAVVAQGGEWSERNVLACEPNDLKAIRAALNGRPKPRAFICRGDTTAAVLVKTLKKLGRRIPEDVMVVGFDDVESAAQMDPPLTTIRQPSEAIAAAAFRALVGRIAVPSLPPCEIYLPAPLVARASTRR